MRVLITGASGFVGSTLARRLLDSGCEIRLLLRRSSSVRNLADILDQCEVVYGDLHTQSALIEAVAEVELIYHVAGVVSGVAEKDYFQANATGTSNLYEAALAHGRKVQRFVYVSSLAAAGPAIDHKPRVESEPNNPVSSYGRSKLAGEIELTKKSGRIPFVICRPPAVYGPKDLGMLTFFQLVSKGLRPSLRGVEKPGAYSFIHVEDLVTALVLLGDPNCEIDSGEIFYASGDETLTWDESMNLIARALERKTIALPLPMFLLRIVGHILGVIARLRKKPAPLNADKVREIEQSYWTCSNKKIKENLRFAPAWDIESGFQQTALWYKEQRLL